MRCIVGFINNTLQPADDPAVTHDPLLASGLTIVRNGLRLGYPFLEAIRSALPIVDEYVVVVGCSDDGTREAVAALGDEKIRIIDTEWDESAGADELSRQTNIGLTHVRGRWAVVLQADEVLHEKDAPRLRALMKMRRDDETVDALRFKWFHFYVSYHRYRVDAGWYQKQDRIVRVGTIESWGDAYAFRRIDGRPMRSVTTGCYIYHYGWVRDEDEEAFRRRRDNAAAMGYGGGDQHEPMSLDRFPVYFGSHPKVMQQRLAAHRLSARDWRRIQRKFWWHPARWLRFRYKTPFRDKRAWPKHY